MKKTVIRVNAIDESLKEVRHARRKHVNEALVQSAAERSLENSWIKDLRSTGYNKVRLTKEQEQDLLHAYLDDGDQKAYGILMQANAMLVYSIAQKYCRNREDMTDFVSEGFFGLDQAIKHYDFSKGYRLSTIAYPWITKKMREYMYGTNSGLVVKPHAQQIGKNIREQRARFYAKNGRYPDREELKDLLLKSRNLRVPDDELDDLVMSSTNAPVAGDDEDGSSEYGETGNLALRTASKNEYENQLDDEEIQDRVENLLSKVDPRTRQVLQMKFGLYPYDCEHDDQTIADELGITSMTVRNIYTKAYKKLAAMA